MDGKFNPARIPGLAAFAFVTAVGVTSLLASPRKSSDYIGGAVPEDKRTPGRRIHDGDSDRCFLRYSILACSVTYREKNR